LQSTLPCLPCPPRPPGARPALRCTYIHDPPSGRRVLGPTKPEGPRPSCLACGQAVVTLRCDLSAFTLGALIKEVLKKELAMVTPMLTCGGFVYEEGEGLEEDEVREGGGLVQLLHGKGLLVCMSVHTCWCACRCMGKA
jgi:hypothetical protein